MTTFADVDPTTGETIADVPRTSSEELLAVVRRARAAADEWATMPFSERAALLVRAGERLAERADAIGALITREMGKPLADAVREVATNGSRVAEVMAEVEQALAPQVVRHRGTETRVVREPLGVVAAITPWNFPVAMPLDILLPALGCGNTVVFKPSEHVPLTGAALAACFTEVLPAGVLGLVQGEGDLGAELVAADVDMIGFVGSRDTGRRIMQSASSTLKRLVLELGGKDPLIVMGDADLDKAAECAVSQSLRNTGQVCCSVERIYVDRAVAPEFERLVLEKVAAWQHGDPRQDGVKMGPMVSVGQRAKVERQVADAVAGGARLLHGGRTPAGPGAFYPATVLADVSDELAIARDETFGPVVSITPFGGGEAEAVELANKTEYGLGASVFTADFERGRRMAARIRSGQVGINRYLAGGPGTPWVGARQSGFGFLGGVDGHKQFTIPKSISHPLPGEDAGAGDD